MLFSIALETMHKGWQYHFFVLTLIVRDTNLNCDSNLFLFFSCLIINQYRPIHHPLDYNPVHHFRLLVYHPIHHFCLSLVPFVICILTYLLMIILSLLRIIVGSIAHNCWMLPAYLLINRVNNPINDTCCNINDTSCNPSTDTYIHVMITILHIHTYLSTLFKIRTMNVTCGNHITQLIVSLIFLKQGILYYYLILC